MTGTLVLLVEVFHYDCVMGMRVGELSRRTGVGVSTLRAWEHRFHFLQPQRSPAGHRQYLESDVKRVEAVLRLESEGLTLPAAISRVSSAGTGALPAGEAEALLYGQIFQAAGQGIWVSREGRTRYVNRRMAELMGCSIDELVAAPVLDFIDPGALGATKQQGAMVKAGRRLHFTQELRRADGSTFLAEVDTAPLFNQSGRYEGAVALIDDITARTEAETNARFRAVLLDSIGQAVAAADPDGKLVYVNAAAERLFGWRGADVIGKDGRELIAAPGASGEAAAIHSKLLAGKRYSGELNLTRRDRTEFNAHLTAAPAFDDHGALLGLIAVVTDQTEHKQLDRQRRALKSQIETLALLGVHALRQQASPDVAATLIVTEAVEATRRLLHADHVTVLEVTTSTDELQVRATSPHDDEPTVIPSGSRSFAGYTALARKVVVVADTRDDDRFQANPIRDGVQTTSAIGAPIFGPDGIRGVLTAESSTPDRFDHSADHFMQGIANIIGVVLLNH
jgi:PAS domain S-box-containing protein